MTPHDRLAEYMPLVYDQLRKLAARRLKRERAGHTLQPTALVNEVYLKFQKQQVLDVQGRSLNRPGIAGDSNV